MYSRTVADQVLEFGVSGKLVRNVLVMYDRQTSSLWLQLTGEAIEGPLSGQKLEFLPSRLTTWGDWKERHPDTLALVKGYQGEHDPYLGYYASGRTGVIGETFEDERLATKQFVIGVELGDEAVAYPYGRLSQMPVVNDVVGEVPILVVFDAENGGGVVHERRVNGQVLTFHVESGLRLTDSETGSLWNGLTGESEGGELKGARLRRVKSTSAFWFGWKDIHPGTQIYGD